MEVQINGKKQEIELGMNLKQILEARGVNPNVVACELNLKVIRRQNLSETVLKPGDELEIIQMIGGG